ncbi:MAG TPA: amino acid adenylation domain-containing protein, partial [Vicinamibacterales bacterium]
MTGIVAHRSLVDAFAAAAAAHAGRTAIEDGDRSVSYRQLEERAGRMAARFVRAGLVPGDRVALLLEPGIDAVAAMFGALRIGAAYVPLDPADPPARLEALLRDAGPRALATAPDRVPEARALVGDDVAVLAADDDEPIEAPGPAPALAPDTIAFVMYTSGSTGEPKGVLQTHGNLLHYIEQYASTLRIAPSDRHSMLYSLSFSASSMDVYGALLNGATLCFLNVRRLGVAPLAGWIDEKRITILHTVPSLFRHLAGLADGVPGRFASVRAIDLGGEMVTPSDVDLWRAHFRPDSLLVNHLAATEISVIAQYVVPRDGGCDGVVPAGRPAKDVVITILREDGSRAAPGEVGEIVVSSPYVSPGYWRRDALTSAAFSDDPERPGWRRYRSGDRGMLTADGLLVAMGRGDAVVKVRGHSVHLAEVEAALRRDAAVRDAVVIAGRHADERRGTRLIAYVVPDTIDGVALRRRLARRLPRHAIPSAIHPISALPRTPTGKIDRRALESGAYDRAARPVGRSALADPLEQEVASIFVRLLEIADVDRGDDFFELGGDSLLLLALQEELQRAFGCEIQAEDLLLDASVGAVAALVRRAKERAAAGEVVPAAEPGAARLIALRTSGSGRPLFLVHGGTGVAGASPALLDALGREQPLYGFQARGYDGGAPPHDSVADMAAEYLELLRRVQPRGPYFLGAVCAGAVVALEMAQRLREAGERVAPLLLIDPPAPHCGRPALPSLINRVGLAIGARLLGGRVTERVAVRLLRRRFGDHELRRVARHDDPGRAGARLRV